MNNEENPNNETMTEEPVEAVEPQRTLKKQILSKRVVRNFMPIRSNMQAGGGTCWCSRSR